MVIIMNKTTYITFLSLVLFSCGTIKKIKEHTEINQNESENIARTKDIFSDSKSFSLEPVDLSKPIVFTNNKGEKRVFENSKVVYNNTKIIEKVKDTISYKNESNLKIDKKDKEEKTDNTFLLLLALLFINVLILIKKDILNR